MAHCFTADHRIKIAEQSGALQLGMLSAFESIGYHCHRIMGPQGFQQCFCSGHEAGFNRADFKVFFPGAFRVFCFRKSDSAEGIGETGCPQLVLIHEARLIHAPVIFIDALVMGNKFCRASSCPFRQAMAFEKFLQGFFSIGLKIPEGIIQIEEYPANMTEWRLH